MQYYSKRHRLHFKIPGGTSRGILKTKDSWYIIKKDQSDIIALGEASIIEGLNPERSDDMDSGIRSLITNAENYTHQDLRDTPAIRFGYEILEKSYSSETPFSLFDTDFTRGERGIAINGLIWMGPRPFMFDQIRKKLDEGYRCLKLKIGAIDFEEELSLLSYIRSQFDQSEVELRVDANGAFAAHTATDKLSQLAKYDIHSIEQPIAVGQWEDMARLCRETPIPIALDEELIGITDMERQIALLDLVDPQYIILKPSLVGGWAASEQWIDLAKSRGVGWWVTSALESNVGLNAIAQWVSTLDIDMPQGLGTGGLYTNNIASPLSIRDAHLYYDPSREWDISLFKSVS